MRDTQGQSGDHILCNSNSSKYRTQSDQKEDGSCVFGCSTEQAETKLLRGLHTGILGSQTQEKAHSLLTALGVEQSHSPCILQLFHFVLCHPNRHITPLPTPPPLRAFDV